MCQNNLADVWPDDLYFVVPLSGGSYISDGGNIIALPAAFNGWKVRVVRNNQPMDYGQQVVGDPYYTQDISTNTVALSNDAAEGDKFQILAYKPAS